MFSEPEYWRIYELIRGDVEAAIKCHHAHLTINGLAADQAIHTTLNKFPGFWTLNTFALQTTFFIALGRLFDKRRDSHSIEKLIDLTIRHPELFSKACLRERKRQSLNHPATDPEWLEAYVRAAWEPTATDLEPLRTALAPYAQRFREIYAPIRHSVYAHQSMQSSAAIAALFSQTLLTEVTEMLRLLHTLLWSIWQTAWNAKRPDFADFSDHDGFVKGLDRETEAFIRQLP